MKTDANGLELFSPIKGQDPMWRNLGNRLGKFKVISKFGMGLISPLRRERSKPACFLGDFAAEFSQVGVIPDCGVGQGVTPPAEYGICSGFLAVCQKTERIP